MYEVVTTDSESVTVTADLPYGEVWVSYLCACCYGSGTTVYGVHTVCSHVVWQTA